MDTIKKVIIDPGQIKHPVGAQALGLNVNFLADHAEMRRRGQGYVAGLCQMGVRSLRYPGGEKSNEYFWSQPPWKSPRPTLSLTGPEARLVMHSHLVSADGEFQVKPMDFDEFIAICREVNAEPLICVGLGSAYVKNRPGRLQGSTRARVIENAVEWVRYANKVKGYGVKYWEIGNESYWRGSVAALTAADYTRDLLELAQAMKAVDPTILIGANGHVEKNYISTADADEGPIWWQYLLEHASAAIDFVVVHPYPCFEWGSYQYYLKHKPVFTDAVDQAVNALRSWASPADAKRIRILATETNTFDWAASDFYRGYQTGWKWRNDLGHALVLFDLLGQHLMHPRLDMLQVWNTRWFESESKLEDVLDNNNELLPSGQILQLWTSSLQSYMISLPDQEAGPAFASYSPETKALTVFLANKQLKERSVALVLDHYVPRWRAASNVFTGNGADDEHPVLKPGGTWQSRSPFLSLQLPPTSITVITFEAQK